jgi:acyl-CoA reductase-like NAD-dependent aldehyde dehydrogenase
MSLETWTKRQIRLKRERGQRMARARWRKRDAEVAALNAREAGDPLRVGSGILDRVIRVVRGEAREAIRYEYDSERSWRRKLRSLGLCPAASRR